jgi:hypothetical protein
LRGADAGVDARPVVADQSDVLAAPQSLHGEGRGERAHFVGEPAPAPGLPDAEIFFPDRGPLAALLGVAHEELRKSVQRAASRPHQGLLERADFCTKSARYDTVGVRGNLENL